MAYKSGIDWCDSTWNVTTGCTRVSEGCRNCWARELHSRRHKAFLYGKEMPMQYSRPFDYVQCHEDRLLQPYHWHKPRRIFVCSMSDLFHKDVPDEFIDQVFFTMNSARGNRHLYMILTKRSKRMKDYINSAFEYSGWWWIGKEKKSIGFGRWPLPNLLLGVSIEDQATADERIPELLATPAAKRFVSYEPALGPVDLSYYLNGCPRLVRGREYITREMALDAGDPQMEGYLYSDEEWEQTCPPLSWVVTGAESGPGARLAHPDWFRSVRDQCQAAGVPFFLKQMQVDGKLVKMPELDGKVWNEYPE